MLAQLRQLCRGAVAGSTAGYAPTTTTPVYGGNAQYNGIILKSTKLPIARYPK